MSEDLYFDTCSLRRHFQSDPKDFLIILGCSASGIFSPLNETSERQTFCLLMTSSVVFSSGENPLAFLRTQPQFLHMRQAIQQNPALLPTLLQQLGRENPQLLQVSPRTPGHLPLLVLGLSSKSRNKKKTTYKLVVGHFNS